MKKFRVFSHPIDGLEAVKIGFSWPALFFTGIWLLLKALWVKFLLVFFAMVILGVLDRIGKDLGFLGLSLLASLSQTIIYLWIPFVGNDWRAKKLLDKGYVLLGVFEARGVKDALDQAESKEPVRSASISDRIEPTL